MNVLAEIFLYFHDSAGYHPFSLSMQGILKHLFNCISYCSPAGRSLPKRCMADWAKNRIQADLAPFAQLSKEQLRLAMDDPAYLENPDLIAYRIFKGKLSIQATRGTRLNERVVAVTKALHRTCMRNAMPDMDFLVTLHDAFTYVAGPNPLKAPLFPLPNIAIPIRESF